ncbi:hypothetical protein P872_22050 [Rhodonellum psychrophilum GCM71 = DSM 17998]|uniref:Uncharacterized protein n=1 Tax=Rhodonellum psychrophilum GCM71 = DSM 17998 TaxID=1123057 RepID=U5BUM2_9BACT|nr:hypothetical protein P872_22050 [Rhodonellum psychrophilum GCM71 = DSM 17998]
MPKKAFSQKKLFKFFYQRLHHDGIIFTHWSDIRLALNFILLAGLNPCFLLTNFYLYL